jgi:hypothetical protein
MGVENSVSLPLDLPHVKRQGAKLALFGAKMTIPVGRIANHAAEGFDGLRKGDFAVGDGRDGDGHVIGTFPGHGIDVIQRSSAGGVDYAKDWEFVGFNELRK